MNYMILLVAGILCNQLNIKINNLTNDVEKISNKKWKFFKLFLFIILNLF